MNFGGDGFETFSRLVFRPTRRFFFLLNNSSDDSGGGKPILIVGFVPLTNRNGERIRLFSFDDDDTISVVARDDNDEDILRLSSVGDGRREEVEGERCARYFDG